MDARDGRAERFAVGASATLDELEGDPHALLAGLREREPVSWVPVLEGWMVTRHDLAIEMTSATPSTTARHTPRPHIERSADYHGDDER